MKKRTAIPANSIEPSGVPAPVLTNVMPGLHPSGSAVVTEAASQQMAAAKASDNDSTAAIDEETKAQLSHGKMVLSASFASASTALLYSKFGKSDDFSDAFLAILDKCNAVKRGDYSELEEVLVSQIQVLNAMFCRFASNAAGYVGKDIEVVETYLRIAMKAQSQSRASIETLALMKNPTTVFARQANIASGPQQVNNAAPRVARAKKRKKAQNELKGASRG